MIAGAIIGALIVGGVALAVVAASFVVDRTPLWPMGVLTVIGVALAGAGFGAMIGSLSPAECPPGTVQADSRNDLFRGCIPLELARKQVGQ